MFVKPDISRVVRLVKERQGKYVHTLGRIRAGGGYVMATGDEVPVDAKIENLRVMVEMAGKHGRYK